MNGRELDAYDIEWNFHPRIGSGQRDSPKASPTQARFRGPQNGESVTAHRTNGRLFLSWLSHPSGRRMIYFGARTMAGYTPPRSLSNTATLTIGGTWSAPGPLMLTDWVFEGSSATFAKNPDYWGYDEKYPEKPLALY